MMVDDMAIHSIAVAIRVKELDEALNGGQGVRPDDATPPGGACGRRGGGGKGRGLSE